MGSAIVVTGGGGGGGSSVQPNIPVSSMLLASPLHLWDVSRCASGASTIVDQGSGALNLTVGTGPIIKSATKPFNCLSFRVSGATTGAYSAAAADIPDGNAYTFLVFASPFSVAGPGFLINKLFVNNRDVAPYFDSGLLFLAGGALSQSYALAGSNNNTSGGIITQLPLGTETLFAVSTGGFDDQNKLTFNIGGGDVFTSSAIASRMQFGAGAYGVGSTAPNADVGQNNPAIGEIYAAAVFLSQISEATLMGWWKSFAGVT